MTKSNPLRPPVVDPSEVELGYISGVFGVHGEVRVHLYNRDSVLTQGPQRVTLLAPDGTRRQARIVVRSGSGLRFLGRIEGLTGREQALALKGCTLVMHQDQLPAPGPGEFYVREILGFPVIIQGANVGRVVQVHPAPAGDLLEVDTGRTRCFVPLVARWVLRVDVQAGQVELAPGALTEE